MNLELQDLVGVFLALDLLGNFACLRVSSSLQERLGMVKFVLVYVGVELGELVVHLSGVSIVLDVEVAMTEKTEGSSVSRRELKLVVQDANNLLIFLVTNE